MQSSFLALKGMSFLFLVLLHLSTVSSQSGFVNLERVPEKYNMHGFLFSLGKHALLNKEDALNKMRSLHYPMNAQDEVLIELIAMNSQDVIDLSPAIQHGAKLVTIWKNRASAYILPERLLSFAEATRDYYAIDHAMHFDIVNEGPGKTNSIDFTANGADGSGLKIAIMDLGFAGLTEAQDSGAAPASYTGYDYSGNGIESGPAHGTACLETVYDYAPGSEYFVHRLGGAQGDAGEAVDNCISDGVDIISWSLASFNTGWNDDTGPVCEAMNLASDHGILCFVSSGNYEDDEHYQNFVTDTDGDDYVEFGGDVEQIFLQIDTGEILSVSLQWAAIPDGDNDYDLYLFDSLTNQILEASLSQNSYEIIIWENTSDFEVTVFLAVKNEGVNLNDVELFSRQNHNFNPSTQGNSTTSPSNSTGVNVLSIGAVSFTKYDSLPGATGIITGYSSIGPSNNGMLLPDLVGPTNTTTVVYGLFSGTSCSTPNIAGMTAAFWSNNPDLSAEGVSQVVLQLARIYKDWGDSGDDNVYGAGGGFLHPYLDNTLFVYKDSGNTTGINALPYLNMEDVDQYAFPGMNAIFLDTDYLAPPMGDEILSKEMIYRTVRTQTLID